MSATEAAAEPGTGAGRCHLGAAGPLGLLPDHSRLGPGLSADYTLADPL